MSETRSKRRSMLVRIGSNFAWGMVAELAAKGSLFLVTLHLAHRLSTSAFGEFSFLQTVFMFLWMGTDLGLGMYATREVARAPASSSQFARTFSIVRLVLAIGLVVPALLLIALFGKGELQLWLAIGFSLYLIARALQLDWLLRGLEHYRALALVNVFIAAFVLALTYLLIRGPADAKWASFPWFIGYLVGTVGIHVVLLRRGMQWRWRAEQNEAGWLTHLQSSIHFTLSNGVSSLYQNIPLIYVYHMATAHETGLFAAPFRVAIALVFVTTVFPMTIYPVFTSLHSAGRATAFATLVGASTLVMVVGAGAVTLVAWFYAPELIGRLFGPRYLEAVPVFKWLSVFFLLRSVRAVFVRGVCAVGHERRYSIVAMASVVVLVAILWLLTSMGLGTLRTASIALAITEALVTAAMALLMVSSIRHVAAGAKQAQIQ